jgi:hypothetical protein
MNPTKTGGIEPSVKDDERFNPTSFSGVHACHLTLGSIPPVLVGFMPVIFNTGYFRKVMNKTKGSLTITQTNVSVNKPTSLIHIIIRKVQVPCI